VTNGKRQSLRLPGLSWVEAPWLSGVEALALSGAEAFDRSAVRQEELVRNWKFPPLADSIFEMCSSVGADG
jgi:hypothetical protein